MIDGLPYTRRKYDQIVEDQVTISYLSKSISLIDTDSLAPRDRDLVLNTLLKIKKQESETLRKSLPSKSRASHR